MAALAKGYSAPVWMTFKQAIDLGGCVRKGEKGSLSVYADSITRTETDRNRRGDRTAIPFMKGYTVFNVEQIDGLPAHYYGAPAPRLEPLPRIAHAEAFFAATGADIRNGGNRAYYATGSDHIQMPPFEAFRDPESYYATLAHESTHWTRHPRALTAASRRSASAMKAMQWKNWLPSLARRSCAPISNSRPELRDDHASYIDHWLTVLKDDKRAIFTAAAHAQRAADFLHGPPPGRAAGGGMSTRHHNKGLDCADPTAHPAAPGQGVPPRRGLPSFQDREPLRASPLRRQGPAP